MTIAESTNRITSALPRGTAPIRVMHVLGGKIRSGVDSVVLTLARGLRESGDEAIVVPLVDGEFAEEARGLGLTVVPLAKRCRYDVSSLPRLARMIRRYEVDVVHAHEVNGAFYACPSGRMARVPAQVCTFHVDTRQMLKDVYRRQLPRTMAYRYYLWLTRMCNRLITVTQDLRETLIRDGVPPEKIVCVPNAIDLKRYDRMATARELRRAELGVPDSALVVGSVSRLAPIKNLPMLLSVAARIVEDGADVRFVIVGEGPERERLKAMATRLGIARSVLFTGWRTDVPELLAAFDVLVMTSLSEAMPIVAMEAMALSRPVVATSVGGMKELVQDGHTGHLVTPGDVESMTQVLHAFARDREQARAMGEAGRARVQRDFTRTTMLKRTRRVYASALRREGTPGHVDLPAARAV